VEALGEQTGISLSLHPLGSWCLQLSTEHPIPESAGDTESVLEVGVVVLEVIFLELLVVQREAIKY
jgi:hypothetical protein